VCVIAETDTNEAKIVLPRASGGWGLAAQWSDDFHHTIHTVLTREYEGYYQDFGKKEQIVRALNDGFVFQGEIFRFWNKPRGTRPTGVPLPAHVICIQNHDQVGNRATGERLNHLVPMGAFKLAAALLLLAPHTPLLFMGEEWAASSPFQFFTDFGDPALQQAVNKGRREEFKDFADFTEREFPEPQDPETFHRSKLRWEEANDANEVLRWYRALLELRRSTVMQWDRTCRAELRDGSIVLQLPENDPQLMVIAAFPDSGALPPPSGWRERMGSSSDGFEVRIYQRE
jgi:maltooligosyltrehalose trehalohydrolase